MLVKEWPLVCTMFNGDSIMGPVPTLFAENIEVRFKKSNLKQYKFSKYMLHTGGETGTGCRPGKGPSGHAAPGEQESGQRDAITDRKKYEMSM